VLLCRAEDIQTAPTEDRTPDLTMWVYRCGLFIMKITAKFMVHWLIHNHSPESLTTTGFINSEQEDTGNHIYSIAERNKFSTSMDSDIIFRDSSRK
jgi:hypothetical protein